jgi:hypothetical protein
MATYSPNEQFQASAKVWLARIYVQDLEEFATGDVNRFSRMVDGKGVAIASPAMWLEHIAGIADNPVVRCFYADKMTALLERLTKAGYKLPSLFD